MSTSPALPEPFSGIIPPMVTPLSDQDRIDVEGTGRLVEHILAGGVHGLFILGTTGEGPGLSHDLRREFIDLVCRQVAGRVPVLVGITDTSLVECLAVAEHSAAAGAAGLVLSAPYYFPATQDELLSHMLRTIPQFPLPVFLYNMPSHTKLAFEPDTVRRLMDVPNAVGMKDSSGNMTYFHTLREITRQRPGWTLLVGPDTLLGESVMLGGDGGVCSGANLCPRLLVEVYEAAKRGDGARVAKLQPMVMRIRQGVYSVGSSGAKVAKGLKCALSCLGICDDFMAEPFQRHGELQREQIRRNLEEEHDG